MEHVKNEYEHQVNASEIQIKVIYSSKYFNSEYMEYVGYGKCEKWICTSGEVSRNTNKIVIQLSPKTHINKLSSTTTLGFSYYTQKDTCGILSKKFVSSRIQ